MSYYGLYIPMKTGGTTSSGASASSAINTTGLAASAAAGAGGEGGTDQNGGGGGAESQFVFRKKSDALRVLKMYKDARLREFSNTDDAFKYAQTGYEEVQTRYNDVKTSTAAVEKAIFRAPTKQELIEFRKLIESGDYEHVKSIIWDNPRYLVSSGDTPTALKEGYRYNAMHVCAISKKPRIAELILQTVSDPNFVDLLTGKKNDVKMCKELAANLLDYYLNIPEKGRSETPLHFAAKNGAAEMVEVLTSYPECKMTINSDGFLPKEIICTRAPHASPELYKKIEQLLDERFYVPVIRSVDNAVPPLIGEPFAANNPPNLNCDPLSPEVKIQALAGPMKKDQAKQFCRRWKTPPRIGSNTSSPIANSPFISPVKSRTPAHGNNRSFETSSSSLQRRNLFKYTQQASPMKASFNNEQPKNGTSARFTPQHALFDTTEENKEETNIPISVADKQNGNHSHILITTEEVEQQLEFETNNNQDPELPTSDNKPQQSDNLKTLLYPLTPLLQKKKEIFFTYRQQQNAPSPVFFNNVKENHDYSNICERDMLYDTPGFKERHLKITDTEKGLEVIGRELAKEQNIEWREYWDFLDSFLNIATLSGLQKLENFFAQRVREAELEKKTSLTAKNASVNFDDVCSALEKMGFSKETDAFDIARNGFNANDRSRHVHIGTVNNSNVPQSTTPYTCVEKSLQVFAKRMTKTILNNIEKIVPINDAFLSELKRLKSLICSFKDDARFLNVNFAMVHSRFANLIANYLENSQDVDAAAKAKIQKCLQHILLSPGDRKEQLHCVCKKILVFLESRTEQILPENLKTEVMCSKAWLAESECDCQWESNLSRKTSRRNRMETRYKNHQQAMQDIAADKLKENAKSGGDAAGNFDEWRNPLSGTESEDELNDDVFWSDFGDTDTEEDEDVWFTPAESLSRISMIDESEKYSIFVYGKEPTKRDLDVLNAILHVEINQTNYPNVYNWKTAVLRYSCEDMDYFPSPSIVKKSHSVLQKNVSNTELKSPRPQKVVIAKSLFLSPSRPQKIQQHQLASTPLNKIRGLFSAYRERLDISPLTNSPASTSGFNGERNGEDMSSLSLFNVSATE